MKKFLFALFLSILITARSLAQETLNPIVESQNNPATIEKIVLTDNETIVYIKIPKQRALGGWVQISSATVLVPMGAWSIEEARRLRLNYPDYVPSAAYSGIYKDAIQRINDWREAMDKQGWIIRNLGPDQLDTKYKSTKEDTYFELHFDRVITGIENVFIRELIDGGFEWYNIEINNPCPNVPNHEYNEVTIKPIIDKQNDGIVGIYQSLDETQYKLACYNDNGIYKLIYLSSRDDLYVWNSGDEKAVLEPTATAGLYTAVWNIINKTPNPDCYIIFEGNTMKTFISGNETIFVKLYPSAPSSTIESKGEWSGTGFALKNNYIVTNFHVVDGAKSICIQGINGDFNTRHKAKVIAVDKLNDLAILQIEQANVSNDDIPYSIITTTADVGEDIFVLGYPLTSTMGDEIKLTTGIISSKTGFQGDVSSYQISAPIQPGNSGGPLFDYNGNVIGIVSSKYEGAENVGYAVKASYLRNLMESIMDDNILPKSNKLSTYKLSNKVKELKNFVYYIICTND